MTTSEQLLRNTLNFPVCSQDPKSPRVQLATVIKSTRGKPNSGPALSACGLELWGSLTPLPKTRKSDPIMSFSIGHCKTRDYLTLPRSQRALYSVVWVLGLLCYAEQHMTKLHSQGSSHRRGSWRKGTKAHPTALWAPQSPCSRTHRLLRTHPLHARCTQRLQRIAVPSRSVALSPISLGHPHPTPPHPPKKPQKAAQANQPLLQDPRREKKTDLTPPSQS